MHNKLLVHMPVGGQINDYQAAFSGDDMKSVISLFGC